MILHYLKKEFRPQRTNHYFGLIALAVELLLWILAGDGLRVIASPNYVLGEFVQWIHYGIMGAVFLLLIPFFSGIAAGVGDRDAGVADWCMSLPAPRWKQWVLKGFVAIVTACFFTGLYLVADIVLIERLSVQSIDSILDKNREAAKALVWRGISPLWYMPWFVTLGMFAGSISRSYYRAFAVVVPVGAVAFWAPIIMDPMGLTSVLPASKPYFFEKPWLHVIHLLVLAAVAMALGLRNFGFELPRLRRIYSSALLWVLIANSAAMAVIWKELRIPEVEFKGIASVDRAAVEGVEPIFQHFRIEGFSTMARIPKSNSIAVAAWLNSPDGVGASHDSSGVAQAHRGLVFEVDVATGALTQYPNAAGAITGMDRGGRFFELEAWASMAPYGVVLRGTPFFLPSRDYSGGEPFWWMRWIEPERESQLEVGKYVIQLNGNPLPDQYPFDQMLKLGGGRLRQGQIPSTEYGSRLGLVRDDGGHKATVIDLYGMDSTAENARDFLGWMVANSMMNAPSGYYCVSPDEKWFAVPGFEKLSDVGHGYEMLPLAIKSADGMTSYQLELTKPLYPMVGLRAGNQFSLGRPVPLPHQREVMHVSPSGRYLAYYGWGAEDSDGHPSSVNTAVERTQYEHGVLDLTTGEKKALIEGSWIYTEPSPVRPIWIQYLPLAWSKDGILASLTTDGLSFFREDADSGELRAAGELDLKPMWPMVIGTIQAPMFWDEDTLLLFGSQSLWKVELREAMPGLFNGN